MPSMAQAFVTTMASGCPAPFDARLTLYGVSGRGGGPEMLRPLRSYAPPWQLQNIRLLSFWKPTTQSRCVQVAVKARKSVSETLTRMTGSAPKRTIFNPLSLKAGSFVRPASMELVDASGMRGGLTYRRTG